MSEKTAWERAAAAEGTTASERALARLARKAFLSLWSYANVFTDEDRSGSKGDGKELCDLLVVFGNNVVLFSDKHCAYQDDVATAIAWPRWYKRAIEKSVRQLAGAEKFARDFPQRIFLDKACQTKLPIVLPDPGVARYFLIAVTRGSHLAARAYFGGGSSGSLMLSTAIRGKQHYDEPFHVGFPLESGRFVHVVDEVTVDLLLEELDTVPDLISYLKCKEEFLQQPGVEISVPGEEDLLARYMMTLREGEHALPHLPKHSSFIALPEGEWDAYASSPQRAAKRKADEISYAWDRLIERQSAFIRAGTAITVPGQPADHVDHERIMRALAEQNRLARRDLSTDLHHVLSRGGPGQLIARIKATGKPPNRAFVFLSFGRPAALTYDDYRAARMHAITVYCHGIQGGMPTLREAVGIASEPFSEAESSQDMMYVDLSQEMSDEERRHWRAEADKLNILRPKSEAQLFRGRIHEFPMPFDFSAATGAGASDGMPMNRAARRRMAKEERSKRRPR